MQSSLKLHCKQKSLVPYEDEALTPRYHLGLPFTTTHSPLTCSSAYAVTGIPVPVYSHKDFFGKRIRRRSTVLFCEGFQPVSFFSISRQTVYSS